MHRRHVKAKLILLLASVVFALLIGEVAFRVLCTVDEDGNTTFGQIRVLPLKPPVHSIQRKLDHINSLEQPTYLGYDPSLGWTIRPNASRESKKATYHADPAGIRTLNKNATVSVAPTRTRIALFGDSYTHGDNVDYADTFAHQVEALLNERGLNVEVVNFGVPGYGIGQAYLRWKTLGVNYKPDIVVYGYCAENMARVVNVMRPLYFYKPEGNGGILYSKPRFTLHGDLLKAVNQPAVPPDQIVATLESFHDSDLAAFEFHYNPDDYERRWYQASKVVSFLCGWFANDDADMWKRMGRAKLHCYALDSEAGQVSWKIIETFRDEAEAAGSRFVVLHLPWEGDVRRTVKDMAVEYEPFLSNLDRQFDLIHPLAALTEEGKQDGVEALFKGHYTRRANTIIAQRLADRIEALLKSP